MAIIRFGNVIFCCAACLPIFLGTDGSWPEGFLTYGGGLYNHAFFIKVIM